MSQNMATQVCSKCHPREELFVSLLPIVSRINLLLGGSLPIVIV